MPALIFSSAFMTIFYFFILLYCYIFYFFILFIDFHENEGLFYSFLCIQHLEQCLAYSRCSRTSALMRWSPHLWSLLHSTYPPLSSDLFNHLFVFGHAHHMWKFSGQGLNVSHSDDNAGLGTRELLIFFFLRHNFLLYNIYSLAEKPLSPFIYFTR